MFNSELVVYSGSEPLLTANVAFRGLNRDMTEKKLDLFKFTAGGMAKPRTRSAKIVRVRDEGFSCSLQLS